MSKQANKFSLEFEYLCRFAVGPQVQFCGKNLFLKWKMQLWNVLCTRNLHETSINFLGNVKMTKWLNDSESSSEFCQNVRIYADKLI